MPVDSAVEHWCSHIRRQGSHIPVSTSVAALDRVGLYGGTGRVVVVLQGLKPYAEDAAFREKWSSIKYHNKERFAVKVKEWTGIDIPAGAMYDIHIKRIHEYKRQCVTSSPPLLLVTAHPLAPARQPATCVCYTTCSFENSAVCGHCWSPDVMQRGWLAA